MVFLLGHTKLYLFIYVFIHFPWHSTRFSALTVWSIRLFRYFLLSRLAVAKDLCMNAAIKARLGLALWHLAFGWRQLSGKSSPACIQFVCTFIIETCNSAPFYARLMDGIRELNTWYLGCQQMLHFSSRNSTGKLLLLLLLLWRVNKLWQRVLNFTLVFSPSFCAHAIYMEMCTLFLARLFYDMWQARHCLLSICQSLVPFLPCFSTDIWVSHFVWRRILPRESFFAARGA